MMQDRLRRLINVLENVQASDNLLSHFDMDHWFGENAHGCGTSACALGYAAIDPRLQAMGLKLLAQTTDGRRLFVDSVADFDAFAKPEDFVVEAFPVFNGDVGMDAGALFFGITGDAARYLFDPTAYNVARITPGHVIERIGEVIACDGDCP